MMWCHAITGLGLCLCCATAQAMDLKVELANESRTTGLALVAVVGQNTVVVPFDKEPRYFTSKYAVAIPTFSKSGGVIGWNIRSLFHESQLVIETIKGERVANKIFRSDVSVLSIAETCDRIAIMERSGKQDVGLFDLRWASMDLNNDGFIDRMQGQDSHGADWSRECRFLAYGKGDRIYIFDSKNRASSLSWQGYDPAWSPDGRRITYRGPVGNLLLADPKGGIRSWPLESHHALAAIRWSPSGKYVSFIEKISPRRPGMFSATTRLVVCRVEGGDCLTKWEFGEIRGYYEFNWITSYESFCRDCRPAARFN